MLKLELTVDEGQALLNLLDLAVKASGIPAAEAALPLVGKIRQAYNMREVKSVTPISRVKPSMEAAE